MKVMDEMGRESSAKDDALRLSVTLRRRPVPGAASPDADSLLDRIFRGRNLSADEVLNYGLDRLLLPDDLLGVQEAASHIATAVQDAKRILVVGDFDCDGATSTAVAVRALRLFGSSQIDFLVPNRFSDGYGLSPLIVEKIAALPTPPQLIITVDNGISSVEGVALAAELGIEVIITDHHLAGAVLPAAKVIVNPNQPGCSFPSKATAGVGVIFYVMLATRRELHSRQHFGDRKLPNLGNLLDLVALGTVADVVALDQNNRTLVSQGLSRIRKGRSCAGIAALIRVAGRDPERMTAKDLGYAIAPRLNAVGRMDDMRLGIQCLLCEDALEASQIAGRLDRFNTERKQVEATMRSQADEILANIDASDAEKSVTVCLFDESWHQGVIGILAGRLKDRQHKPTVIFAPAGERVSVEDDDLIKGSARSIPGLHIRDALEMVASAEPELILAFGGHAMAAGLTIRRRDFARFKSRFEQVILAAAGEGAFEQVIHTDGDLAAQELCIASAEVIDSAGPWGQAFPEPVFDGLFKVIEIRVMAEKHLKLMVLPLQAKAVECQPLQALLFNAPDSWLSWAAGAGAGTAKPLRLVYRLDINEFRGRRDLQLIIVHCGIEA
ncbi:single-stranded-DNA-specific exonuclease RecJ [Allohahella marinimesophila]|uniref:Single-stranded-DNA-specific exonuclease RecJ n=1 Tax=Allohahella marinimesophila TaxID=1054972 RepID=A0ABP7Q4C2_9GAMM